MRRAVLGLAVLTALGAPAAVRAQRSLVPRAGLVLTRSTVLRAGTYHLAAAATMDSAVIVVRGNNLTVDLAGVHLIGAPVSADPDRAAGVAILVDGGTNVTIKNGHIRGYK